MKRVIATCGGFSPLHSGHIELFKRAKSLGGRLIVILNNDNWLKEKKGFVFMDQKERKKIIESIKYVDKVIISNHKPGTKDMSVCNELNKLMPDVFCKGGDRNRWNIPETKLCNKLGIRIIDGLGKKINSSTDILENYRRARAL